MAVALPAPAPRRVSYVLPPPTAPPPLLSLPDAGVSRRGHAGPLYSRRAGEPPSSYLNKVAMDQNSAHPRHRLAVQALALDLSTAMSGGARGSGEGDASPDGILYTGGRDGLLCSWELGLPTKRRKVGYGRRDWDEDANELDSDSDADMSDGERETSAAMDQLSLDELGKRPVSVASRQRPSYQNGSSRPRRGSSTSTTKKVGRGAEVDNSLPVEERWEVDGERAKHASPRSTFRQALQSHTDWINDIVLCNYNRTLVSASSDSLVLAWNPHSASHEEQVTPMQVGRHGDYVRCLAAARDAHWVASGGFDRKIRLWDIGEGRSSSVLELPSPPASVYSLTSTPSGSLLAAGTPERVVRVWDPRSRRQVARLGGHTDNVRGVLLGEEGKWLLSASSDSTVKLWSLSAQKCLHTFSHHAAPVWSLFSQHPTLEVFYSGDKAGNVCKIDLEGTGDPGEGECILLARDGPDDAGESRSGCEGITQLIAQDDSWVWTAGGSSSVKRWKDIMPRSRRAGAIARRPEDTTLPEAREMEGYTELRSDTPPAAESPPDTWERDRVGGPTVSFLEGLTSSLARTTSSPSPHSLIGAVQPGANRPSSLRTRPAANSTASQTSRPSLLHYGHSSSSFTSPSTTLYDIPYDSLVPLTSPEDTYFSPAFSSRARDPDAATIYSSHSVLSVPQFGITPSRPSASTSPSSSGQRPQSLRDHSHEPAPHPTSIARREYLEREGCNEAVPLRSEPDDVIQGRHGLTRCETLSDRRHVLTLDTEDEIALWDIVQGRCLGVFAPDELNIASKKPFDTASSLSGSGSTGSESVSGADVLDYVRERIEGEASVATWCKCDTRVGSLTVHLEEARVFDAEIYADEANAGDQNDFPPDHRLLLGKWVLRHLFDGFIEAEVELRAGGGTPMASSRRTEAPPNFISLAGLSDAPPLSHATLKSPGMTIALATPALKKALLPPMPLPPIQSSPRNPMWDLASIPQSPGGTPRPFEVPSTKPGAITPGGLRTPTAFRAEGDYFSLPAAEPSEASPSGSQTTSLPLRTPTGLPSPAAPAPTPGSLMGRLRNLGKGSKRPTIDTDLPTLTSPAPEATAEVDEKRTIEEQQQHLILQSVFSRPLAPCSFVDAPPLALREDMALIISEEKDQGAAWAVTYRGLVGTGHADLSVLEQKAPLWLLDFLLTNRVNLKEPVKISFLIQPWKGEGSFVPLPELPNANARLNASRNLRLKKVTTYIADKLQLRSSSRAPSISGSADGAAGSPLPASDSASTSTDYDPEKELEILVGDVLLPLHVTLATARAYYWKNGGDLVVTYRTKGSV